MTWLRRLIDMLTHRPGGEREQAAAQIEVLKAESAKALTRADKLAPRLDSYRRIQLGRR